jgi:hypothetical protein
LVPFELLRLFGVHANDKAPGAGATNHTPAKKSIPVRSGLICFNGRFATMLPSHESVTIGRVAEWFKARRPNKKARVAAAASLPSG